MDVGVVFKDDFRLTRLTTSEELTIASPRNNYLHLRKGAVYEIPFDCGFRHTLEKPEQSLIRKMAEHGTEITSILWVRMPNYAERRTAKLELGKH